MKQYDTDFLESFESIDTGSPHSQKKEINGTYQAVMKEAGLRKNTPSIKKSGRVLLLVAAIAAFTVVTAAAYAFGAGNLFKGFFESNGSKVNGAKPTASLSESQVQTLDKSGAVLSQSVTNNGTTITIRAAVGDKYSAYILLDMVAPEGTKLTRDDYDFAELSIDFHEANRKVISANYVISVQNDENPTDNKKSFVLKISTTVLDLRGRELGLSFGDLSTLPQDGRAIFEHVIEGTWKFNSKLDYDTDSKEIAVNQVTHCEGAIENKIVTVESTVKTVSLSPLSAVVQYSGNFKDSHDFQVPHSLTIRYKDGTQVTTQKNGSGWSSRTHGEFSYLFDAPINLKNVVSITLGDLEIPIK